MSSTRDSRITGLYGMADHEASGGEPERLAAALLQGGCRLIQYRAKGVATEEMLRISRHISRRCAAAGAWGRQGEQGKDMRTLIAGFTGQGGQIDIEEPERRIKDCK